MTPTRPDRQPIDAVEDPAPPTSWFDVPSAARSEEHMSWTTELLFRHHVRDVVRFVGRLLGPGASEADIDDLTQQVFIAADRALPRFRGDSSVTTWLYGISTRVVLQHLRGGRRYRTMIERFEAAMISQPAPTRPDEEAADRESMRIVWGALLKTAPDKRVVFVLVELEGLTVREASTVIGISEAAAKTRLRRARAEVLKAVRKAGLTL